MNYAGLLEKLIGGGDLSAVETQGLLDAAAGAEIDPVQLGAVLVALRMKGETADEIVGLIRAMRSHMTAIDAPGAIDVCGTGGDGANTFNVSTTAAFVVAGAGARVAKHGNRAASSKCGSADVLEALGVTVGLAPEQAESVLREVGMVFLFAPLYHPALKQVAMVRKTLGVRTIFNVLGPFANPAGTTRQLIGVPSEVVAARMAEAGAALGYERLIIATGGGLDEISTGEVSKIFEVNGGDVKKYDLDPARYGFKAAPAGALRGGDASYNAEVTRSVLGGAMGPQRDVVVLNSAVALQAAGMAETVAEGVKQAADSIDGGKARGVLERLVVETGRYA